MPLTLLTLLLLLLLLGIVIPTAAVPFIHIVPFVIIVPFPTGESTGSVPLTTTGRGLYTTPGGTTGGGGGGTAPPALWYGCCDCVGGGAGGGGRAWMPAWVFLACFPAAHLGYRLF